MIWGTTKRTGLIFVFIIMKRRRLGKVTNNIAFCHITFCPFEETTSRGASSLCISSLHRSLNLQSCQHSCRNPWQAVASEPCGSSTISTPSSSPGFPRNSVFIAFICPNFLGFFPPLFGCPLVFSFRLSSIVRIYFFLLMCYV